MNDLEKEANPNHKVVGGYLKELDFKEAFSKSVLGASKDELRLLKKLPNFDADVFLEISGVDVRNIPTFQELG